MALSIVGPDGTAPRIDLKPKCPMCGSVFYPEPEESWRDLGAWYTSQCVLCRSRLIHLVWGADVNRVMGEVTPHAYPGLFR